MRPSNELAGIGAQDVAYDAGLRSYMLSVYNYMASGLALSGIVAVGLFSSAELAGLFIAPLQQFVGLLDAVPRDFAYALNALIEKNESAAA